MSEADRDLEGVTVRKLRPSARRTLAQARASVAGGNAAFLIGAGFDMAMAPRAPSWSALVAELLGVRSPEPKLEEAISAYFGERDR